MAELWEPTSVREIAACMPHDVGRETVWALLYPRWQDGAPTVEQLSRWQWWAIQIAPHDPVSDIPACRCGDLLAGGVEREDTTLAGELRSWIRMCGTSVDADEVSKSAPIQPVLTNGPLWVPLEVSS